MIALCGPCAIPAAFWRRGLRVHPFYWHGPRQAIVLFALRVELDNAAFDPAVSANRHPGCPGSLFLRHLGHYYALNFPASHFEFKDGATERGCLQVTAKVMYLQ
jgi:hypothetical protein